MDVSKVPPQLRHTIDTAPQSYERMLISCVINSLNFYRSVRDHVCPMENGRMRPDFTTAKYNVIYEKIAAYWQLYDEQLTDGDYAIPREQLEAWLVDLGNTSDKNSQLFRMVEELIAVDLPDFYAIGLESDDLYFGLIKGPAFQYWLETRVAKHFLTHLHNAAQGGVLQFEEIDEKLKEYRSKTASVQSYTVNVGELVYGRSLHTVKLQCSIPRLNDQLGGGFDSVGMSLIAGVSGGGKTIMACQLAVDFGRQGLRVAVFTTEQTPEQLTARMVSNYATVNINEFANRTDTDLELNDDGSRWVYNMPQWLFTDPRTATNMQGYAEMASSYLRIVDWSLAQRFSIKGNFENSMEQLRMEGFDPQVVIFDWIGGGLEQLTDRDKVRHLYKDGADCLCDYAK